jgi:hypothetical protein
MDAGGLPGLVRHIDGHGAVPVGKIENLAKRRAVRLLEISVAGHVDRERVAVAFDGAEIEQGAVGVIDLAP